MMQWLLSVGKYWMGQKIRIEAGGLIICAMALLVLPLDWILSAVFAAGIHELGHYWCIRAMGIPVVSLSISAAGCRMETGEMTAGQEFFCALAGPMASFALACFRKWMPLVSFCALAQGLFNLLPMYPMDGGRILQSVAGERTGKIVSFATALSLAGVGIYLSVAQNLGLVPAVFGGILLIRHLKTKNSLQTGGSHGTIELPFFKR